MHSFQFNFGSLFFFCRFLYRSISLSNLSLQILKLGTDLFVIDSTEKFFGHLMFPDQLDCSCDILFYENTISLQNLSDHTVFLPICQQPLSSLADGIG